MFFNVFFVKIIFLFLSLIREKKLRGCPGVPFRGDSFPTLENRVPLRPPTSPQKGDVKKHPRFGDVGNVGDMTPPWRMRPRGTLMTGFYKNISNNFYM
jgi:hypothetical protein